MGPTFAGECVFNTTISRMELREEVLLRDKEERDEGGEEEGVGVEKESRMIASLKRRLR
jgi:hypothetical protein